MLSTTTPTSPASAAAPTWRAWVGLSLLLLPAMLVAMDMSVLYLAIPTISEHLNAGPTAELWILDVYGFAVAGLLIAAGVLGDRFGRRLMLLGGTAVFAVGSLVGAFATSTEILIAARALMGIGGATLLPSSLALVTVLFTDARAKARAIAIWSAAFAGGAALGPVVGGVLLNHFWWGSVLLINAPICALMLIAAPAFVPEFRSGVSEPFDKVGLVLSLGGIISLVYGIKHAAASGVDLTVALTLAAAVALLGTLGWHLRRTAHPLIDLSLFRITRFTVAIGVAFLGMASLAAIGYLGATYLQAVLGYTVLHAALLTLPGAALAFVGAIVATSMVDKIGMQASFVVSVALAAVGNLALLAVSSTGGAAIFVIATSVANLGYGITFSIVAIAVVEAVAPARVGAASGISETSFELGNAFGIAIFGSIATALYQAADHGYGFAPTLPETVHHANATVVAAARGGFVDGMHLAYGISGALLAVLAVIIARLDRRPQVTAPAAERQVA